MCPLIYTFSNLFIIGATHNARKNPAPFSLVGFRRQRAILSLLIVATAKNYTDSPLTRVRHQLLHEGRSSEELIPELRQSRAALSLIILKVNCLHT